MAGATQQRLARVERFDTPDFWRGTAAAVLGALFVLWYYVVASGFWTGGPFGAPLWGMIPLLVGIAIMILGPAWYWIGKPLLRRTGE